MDINQEILRRCQSHFDDVVAIRRDIHRHPETGFDDERTAALASDALKHLGFEVRENIGRTGVVSDLNIPGAKRRIALRADMDALPMQELGNPEYKSIVDGKAHMCGHDSHTAMLIGAARVISEMRDRLKANVRFIFQPNEENLPGGAPAMIRDGALDGVDEIFGLHVWPQLPTGNIGICSGPALGQPDVFEIIINGVGGHAALPNETVDPILIGAQFISNLQSIVARNIDPLRSAVISVTKFHSGETHNVIPQTAEITGTVRTFEKDIQRMIRNKLKNMLAGLCSAHGASFQFDYTDGYPVTFNHAVSVEKALAAAKHVVGEEKLQFPITPVLGGEDFAYYSQEIPGCFIFLGIRNPEKNIVYMCHDPRFDIDEDAMSLGMALHATLALSFE